MNDACTVTFSGDHGDTYYVQCNLVQYLDDQLRNTGSTTITLYPAWRQGQNMNTIQISANSYPQWRPYGSTSYSYITNAEDVEYNNVGYYYRSLPYIELFVWFCVAIACLFHACRR